MDGGCFNVIVQRDADMLQKMASRHTGTSDFRGKVRMSWHSTRVLFCGSSRLFVLAFPSFGDPGEDSREGIAFSLSEDRDRAAFLSSWQERSDMEMLMTKRQLLLLLLLLFVLAVATSGNGTERDFCLKYMVDNHRSSIRH